MSTFQKLTDKVFKKKWIAALRSGKYRKACGQLRRGNGSSHSYCCLGVAAVVWDKDAFNRRGANLNNGFGTLPRWFSEKFGLGFEAQAYLASMNDGESHLGIKKSSHKEIAKWIEENL